MGQIEQLTKIRPLEISDAMRGICEGQVRIVMRGDTILAMGIPETA